MYPAVADKPEGPFKLARGKDEFYKPLLLLLYCRVRIRAGLMLKSLLTTMGRLMCFGDRRACSQTQRGYDYGGFCSTGNFYSSQGVL